MGACFSSQQSQPHATRPLKPKQAPGTPPDSDAIRASPSTTHPLVEVGSQLHRDCTIMQVSQSHAPKCREAQRPCIWQAATPQASPPQLPNNQAISPVHSIQPGTFSGSQQLSVGPSISPALPQSDTGKPGHPGLLSDVADSAAEPAQSSTPAPDASAIEPRTQAAAAGPQQCPLNEPASGHDLVAKYLQHTHPQPSPANESTAGLAQQSSVLPSPSHPDAAAVEPDQQDSRLYTPYDAQPGEPFRQSPTIPVVQQPDVSHGIAVRHFSVVTIAQVLQPCSLTLGMGIMMEAAQSCMRLLPAAPDLRMRVKP